MGIRSRSAAGLFVVAAVVGSCGGSAATTVTPTSPTSPTPPAGSATAPTPGTTPGGPTPAPIAASLGSATSDAALCTTPKAASGTSLTVASYGGEYQKAQRAGWFAPYAAKTGVTFTENGESTSAAIKLQVESGQVMWDVADVGNDFGLAGNAPLLEKLDYNVIPGSEVIPGFASDYRVADITYGVVLAYRTDLNKGVPQGWADFFDLAKFPGKRGIYDYSAGGVFEIALMADGVAPKDLYPLDIPRAIKKLDTIKDSIVWWPSGAASQEVIGSGAVAMSLMWNGRAWSAKNTDGQPVAIQWNQQLLTADFWVIPKGAPNKDAAMNFIAWTICKQNNAAPSDSIPYGPTNTLAKPNPAKAAELAASNINDTTAYFNDQWLVDNATTLDDQFKAWRAK